VKKLAASAATERFGGLPYARNPQLDGYTYQEAMGAEMVTVCRHSSELNGMWQQLPTI